MRTEQDLASVTRNSTSMSSSSPPVCRLLQSRILRLSLSQSFCSNYYAAICSLSLALHKRGGGAMQVNVIAHHLRHCIAMAAKCVECCIAQGWVSCQAFMTLVGIGRLSSSMDVRGVIRRVIAPRRKEALGRHTISAIQIRKQKTFTYLCITNVFAQRNRNREKRWYSKWLFLPNNSHT